MGVKLHPSVSQDLEHLGLKFQRLPVRFRGRGTQWCHREDSISKREVRTSRWLLPKPDVPVSQLLYKIAKKLQWLPHVFGELDGAIGNAPSRNMKSNIRDNGCQTGCICISASIPAAHLTYAYCKISTTATQEEGFDLVFVAHWVTTKN
jgi:hypothetical protein